MSRQYIPIYTPRDGVDRTNERAVARRDRYAQMFPDPKARPSVPDGWDSVEGGVVHD